MLSEQHLALLNQLGLRADQVISVGMQSIVLDAGQGEIIKLYLPSPTLPNFHRLQVFYASLDASEVNFALPNIHKVTAHRTHTLVREAKLSGHALDERRLDALTPAQIDTYLTHYLEALFAVQRIKTRFLHEAELLMSKNTYFIAGSADWHSLLARSLQHKLKQDRAFLPQDVADFHLKTDLLLSLFAAPYHGEVGLIHGDFFPGNLLVDEDLNVTALVDFGTLTTRGDPLFEVATGEAFIDMYDQVTRHPLKSMLRERLAVRLTGHERALADAYLMVYSILTANMYAPTSRDGHYEWCARNLNQAARWESIKQLTP